MRYQDLSLLMLVCFTWALNLVIGRIVLADLAVPPFYYASIRFVFVAIILSPFLRPLPKQFASVVAVGLLLGAVHFGFLFAGLRMSTPSSASIVLQLGIPLTAVLSFLFLGERMTRARLAGTLVAVAGVIVVIWNPQEAQLSAGLIAIVGATAAIAGGGVWLKKLDFVAPMRLQAWASMVSFPPLLIMTALTEEGQWQASVDGGWIFAGAVVFSVLVVTIWANTRYFSLLQRYEANLIAPLTLAMPVMAIGLGFLITGDRIDLKTVLGTVAVIAGVIIVLRARPHVRAGVAETPSSST